MVKRSKSTLSVDTTSSRRNLFRTFGTEADTKNFDIPKKLRFTLRVFEAIFLIFTLSFLVNQDQSLTNGTTPKINIYGSVSFGIVVAAIGICVLIGVVSLYILKIFRKKWTSRRVLMVESILDGMMVAGYIGSFVFLLGQANGQCPPFKTNACDKLNWLLAFTFLIAVLHFSSLLLNLKHLKDGMLPSARIEDLELANRQLERQIRASARSGRR